MKCQFCPTPIQEGEEVENVEGGYAHRDCYFQEFGKIIDEQPIFNPTSAPIRR
jgi:hypothetical protein